MTCLRRQATIMQNLKQLSPIFILCLLLLAGAAQAQTTVGGIDPLQYTVSPQTPGPGQQVTIDVEGVGSFLGDSTITWQQNGKTVAQGVGLHSYTFTTGALGSQTKIHVSVATQSQGTFTHDFIFTPSTVNLVWEADTTAPPFYRGKPLYSAGSTVKVVVFPTVVVNGSAVSSRNLSFQWQRNDVPEPSESGLGRNTFTFVGDQLQPSEDIAVDVYNGNAQVGHGEVVIQATDPTLVLYDND